MRIHFIIGAIILILLGSCKKDTDQIPYVPIDRIIYINTPEWINLSVTGGWEYVSGGSKGLIVFRINPDEFMVYERHCPYQAEDGCRIYVNDDLVSASDSSCCNTNFNLYNGSVITGPSTFPLKSYQHTFDGNVLRIYN